jgi:hypothetical protein
MAARFKNVRLDKSFMVGLSFISIVAALSPIRGSGTL